MVYNNHKTHSSQLTFFKRVRPINNYINNGKRVIFHTAHFFSSRGFDEGLNNVEAFSIPARSYFTHHP